MVAKVAKMRVLLVEDDLVTARAVSLMLKSECSAVVDVIDTGEEALEMARHYDYDAVVLDLMLPDMEGFEVLRRLRAAGQDTPVLVLSGLSRPQVKVRALSAGADDVMTKPFDKSELAARIQAIVRRSKGYSQSGLQIGPLHLNLDSREASVKGQAVHLTGKEYAILELLTLRRGMVLTKDQFLSHLYGGLDEPEMKIIDVFICKLRKKLAAAGAANLIGTVWGRGYTMRAPEAAPERRTAATPTLQGTTTARDTITCDTHSLEAALLPSINCTVSNDEAANNDRRLVSA